MTAGEGSPPSAPPAAYDWLRAAVVDGVERERSRCHQRAAWLLGSEAVLVGVYGFCLQELGVITAQEPTTYPKENIPVATLAWFTAWALPFLGLGLALVMFWLLAASLLNIHHAVRHWRRSEGLAASNGQNFPSELYPPVRAGGWGMLLVPLLFVAFWFFAVSKQSALIESGIENWRDIPQDQA